MLTTMAEIRLHLGRRPARSASRTLVVTVLAPAVMLLLVSACGDDDSSGDNDSPDLAGTSWTLASASIDSADTAAVATATLEFGADAESLTGSTGCNQFAGTYTQDGDELTISLGPVTLAACTDAALTAQETAILAHLPEVASFSSGEQLVLEDSSGDTLLTYDAGMSTIEGTSWTATGVNNGTGGVESSAATESITAEFGSDGALSGFAGCNTYNATYELSDGGISITKVSSTRMACEDAAMTLEGQYLTALEKAATYALSGDTLTLRDSSGATQVTYTLAS
jgi:heat shock protein HslJ